MGSSNSISTTFKCPIAVTRTPSSGMTFTAASTPNSATYLEPIPTSATGIARSGTNITAAARLRA
jgi:hypothetical protein